MNIININQIISNIKNIVLCLDDKNIYISKYEDETYFIVKTDVMCSSETIIAKWKCNEYNFDNTIISIYNDVFLFITQEENYLVIRKVNKYKKGLEFEKRYYIIGNKLDTSKVLCINENNIIVFLEEIKSFSYDGFLCDLLEDKSYYIKDRRIIDTHEYDFELYEVLGQNYICFSEKYMKDWEKEAVYIAYENREIVINDCFESVNIIKVEDFINAIKTHMEHIPFNIIDIVSLGGWTRYIGMDKSHIYYRVKDFKSGIENIYSLSKIRFRKRLILSIQHEMYNIKNKYLYMGENNKIFRIEENKTIKGLFNSKLNVCLQNEIKGNIEYINNKELVWRLEDKLLGIMDLNTGISEIYMGKVYRFGENIVTTMLKDIY